MFARLALAALLLLGFAGTASATTCGTIPYTFTNGTIADANQVNANFASIFNCGNNLLAPKADPVFTGSLSAGNTLFVIDPSAANVFTGNATLLFSPTFSDAHSDAMFGYTVGALFGTSTSANNFFGMFNMKFGDTGTPVASGYKGNLSGYGCNITSAQLLADTNGIDGLECLSGTITTSGTAPINGYALAVTATGNPAIVEALNYSITSSTITAANSNVIQVSQAGTSHIGTMLKIAAGTVDNVIDTSSGTVGTNYLKGTNLLITKDAELALGNTTVRRAGAGGINSHFAANKNMDIFLNGGSGNPLILFENDALGGIPGEISASVLNLNTVGGGSIVLGGPLTFPASTSGAVTPSFTNAPTSCNTVIWIGPLSITSPAAAGTVYIAACHV